MQRAQQDAVEEVTDEHTAMLSMAPWLIKGRELRLRLAEHRAVVTDLIGLLAQGGSLHVGLSAAGDDVGPIVQGLEALAVCYSRVVVQTQHVLDDSEVVERVSGLIKGLESLGQALSVFAVPHCCNNPRCVNISGLLEASIVSGKGCICAGCKVARYCGKPCEAAHWEGGTQACVQDAVPGRASGRMRRASWRLAGSTTQPCRVLGSPGLDLVLRSML